MELHPDYPVRSKRLCLRPLRLDDAPDLLSYRSLPEVCRYVPFEPMNLGSIEQRITGQWSRTTIDNEGQALILGAELVDSEELVGDVMLAYSSSAHLTAEIGYVFNPRFGAHGYATEAAHLLLTLAFEGMRLHRVTARLDARNTASAKVASRIGMRQEAHLIENEWFKGEWTDELNFAILDHEWRIGHDDTDSCSELPPLLRLHR